MPERFGKYILLEKLAAGGMAEIFLSKAPGADGISKFTAIKRILSQYSDNKDFIRMFKDEAKIVINLSHRNIVSMYEFGVVSKQFHIVMDYVEGKNIRQILNKMKKKDTYFTTEQIVYIIKEVSAGLDHAHRCLDSATGKPLNITHRDISPQNVMISYEGDVKIVDFGIAKAESQLETTRAGTLKGKFGYMSPEQAEGQPVDLRTDIFSLGTVLWELLANDRLFISNNEMNTLKKIRECKIPSLKKYNPNIHPELERIVLKALHRDRNHRYQTAAALHRDLNRFLNRQYPDFSPQDFSVSIKTVFADDILKIRKKLMKYSKIQLEDFDEKPLQSNSEQSTFVDGTRTLLDPSQVANTKSLKIDGTNTRSADTTTRTVKNTRTISVTSDDSSGGNVNIDLSAPTTEVSIDTTRISRKLSEGKYGKSPKGTLRSEYYEKNGGDNTDDKLQSSTAIREDMRGHQDNDNDETKTSYNLSNSMNKVKKTSPNIMLAKKSSSFTKSLLKYVMMSFLMTVGSTLYFEDQICTTVLRHYTQLMPWIETSCLSSSDLVKDTPAPEVKGVDLTFVKPKARPKTQESLIYITVQSEPSGAEIFIDGASINRMTPAKITVPEFRKFHLTLKRDGFIDYKKRNVLVSATNIKKIIATMVEAEIAFIDIDVRPPNNAQLYINGKRLKEKLPIKGYNLPANRRVVFEAYNPVTKKKTRSVRKFKNRQKSTVILKF